jgi:4'-phosphopantetheinyl transferase EntD
LPVLWWWESKKRTGMAVTDNPLRIPIALPSVPGIMIAYRAIASGDEDALLPDELPAFAGSVAKVRRASGGARIVARELLAALGHPHRPIPKDSTGAPIWPPGIVGSLSHDAETVVAAVARSSEFSGVGIDVEPAEPLPPDLLDIVATPGERRALDADPYAGRLLFAAKEAAYKAVFPLDREFLEHHDIEIDLTAQKARVPSGREVKLRFALSSRLVALAFIAARPDVSEI